MANRRQVMQWMLPGAAAPATLPAWAQDDFPARPIRLVVPFATGSGTDNSVRNFTQKVAEKTGWTFVIDNKPGGNGIIGINELLRAPADGYTLMLTGGTTHGVNSALMKQLPYDPINDFVPVTAVAFAPMVLLARPSLNVQTAAELVELVRRNPGKMTAATGSSFQVLAINLLRHQAGLDFRDVAYKGSAQSMTDLLGGHVDFTMVDLGAAMPQVRAGALKPLAVTSPQRLASLPDTPTMAEAGLPDIRLTAWAALFVRQGTPEARIAKLREGLNRYFLTPEYGEYLVQNASYHEDMTPAQLIAFIRAEIERAQKTFAQAGIQPQ